MQHVVPALVPKDEQHFVVRHATRRRVPNDNPLGRADARLTYAFSPFVFRLAFIKYMRSGGILVPVRATTFSSSVTKARDCSSGQRLKLVEDRLKQWRHEDEQHQNRQRNHPDAEPVAPRPAPHNPVEQQQHRRADHERQPQRLRLVAKPASPSLHADAVAAAVSAGPIQSSGSAGQCR